MQVKRSCDSHEGEFAAASEWIRVNKNCSGMKTETGGFYVSDVAIPSFGGVSGDIEQNESLSIRHLIVEREELRKQTHLNFRRSNSFDI